jgi:hypothetical protein
MSEENREDEVFEPYEGTVKPPESKYAKYFKKSLRDEENEPEYTEYIPVDPNIYESAPEPETKPNLRANLIFLGLVGAFVTLGVLVLFSGSKEEKTALKPKTRTVTRTVYVKAEDEDKKPEKEAVKPKVGETEKGEKIKEETTEETKEDKK